MPTPVRKGLPVMLTMDRDAVQLLRELAPSTKRYGAMVSELIRAEVARREARREERERIARELMETGALCLHEG